MRSFFHPLNSRSVKFCIAICFLVGCEKLKDPSPFYTYRIPDPGQNEFSVSSLEEEGLEVDLLTELTNRIIRDDYKRIDGLLILRNNKLVYENYFHGHDADALHNIFSSGKSITSIFTGIAVDKGYISNVQLSAFELLPEYKNYKNPDPRKKDITLEHLLNMTSGLDCDDWFEGTDIQMEKQSDRIQFTLDLPMLYDPGTRGSYCTGGVKLLGRIIENQSGLSIDDFANKYLFEPLNITAYQWDREPDGRISASGKIFLRPRDMAKIGLLMLNKGKWKEEQLISEAWVDRSSQSHIKLPGPFGGYGYLWWKQVFENNLETYFSSGNGGQDIFIIPSKKMVIVFTTGNKNTNLGLQNVDMLIHYILPAIK